mmetsp:Transcript_22611/g.40063  ORF Transcript_22611/g.40063 Transcript_22611/m.40063 type:complete len:199 (-) Transcript_22611:257-853(-)|eukprot:CAMPEP_0175039360 /NCGR_PEP_ID=MMETSP0052_2-20121109/528_1 /TAXON_ID=51329 ORGANISM="Polytomella parva, Strain SAG 63-3" /NCGR_SAMPLE_ID=MMETSP0052_2 /ASSEMBLY_ACC=CAM_ASM_000194 /LENGTH=198 /DNA_ID=CAMNT_0016301179 /DNA_START=41 /DNA_END=637 /DNA_ORIENTATION=+
MSFFGLTYLGPSDTLSNTLKISEDFRFHDISEESYEDLFRSNVLGDSDVATALQINGKDHILTAKIGDMLIQLLGRNPTKSELTVWFTHFDFDRSAVMSYDHFLKSVRNLITFSASNVKPRQYNSYDVQRTNWVRHTRVEYEPQQTYKQPLTTASEVGWHCVKPTPDSATKFKTLKSTDVTIKEGRNAASYYGSFVYQ